MPSVERISTTTRNGAGKELSDSQGSAAKQTHVWLTDEDVTLLDDWAYRLRRGGWHRATRSACVRALLTILHDVDIDVAGVSDEDELAHVLQSVLANK